MPGPSDDPLLMQLHQVTAERDQAVAERDHYRGVIDHLSERHYVQSRQMAAEHDANGFGALLVDSRLVEVLMLRKAPMPEQTLLAHLGLPASDLPRLQQQLRILQTHGLVTYERNVALWNA